MRQGAQCEWSNPNLIKSSRMHMPVHRPHHARSDRLFTLRSPAILIADHAAPCHEALRRMLLHPFGKLWCADQAGLHRDVSEVGGGDGLLVAICRRRQTAEHRDDRDHDRSPSPRWTSAPMRIWFADALSRCSGTGSDGGKRLSYIARASRKASSLPLGLWDKSDNLAHN